jgi:Cfr10I/Bse634I restriction endonuclease
VSSIPRVPIAKKAVFCAGIAAVPNVSTSFRSIIASLDQTAMRSDPRVTREALSNCHGDWYEWLLAISAWNWHVAHPSSRLLVQLPNITRFDVSRLYCDRLHAIIGDLKTKVLNSAGVSLITSNPDFVLLNLSDITIPTGCPSAPITAISEASITEIENLYSAFAGQCGFHNIVGFLSAKLSLRPDRRLQLPHEGSLMKALYAHLQTREWVIDPPGLKYYACSSVVGSADRAALQTVATHSITTVFSTPQKAVDDVFPIDTLQEAERVWLEILGS